MILAQVTLIEIIGIIVACFIIAVIAGTTKVATDKRRKEQAELDELQRSPKPKP